jgi:hypothetical protein
MPASTSKTITLTCQHHSGALRLGHLQIAQVSVDVDTNTTNNSSTASITVHYPDVSVSKSGELAVHCRQCGQLQHHGEGAGSGNSTNVTLSNAPLADHTWTVSGTEAGSCSITAGTLRCNFGSALAREVHHREHHHDGG